MMLGKLAFVTALLLVFIQMAPAQENPGRVYKIQNIQGEITKRINIWGYINEPGRYDVPLSTNIIQLLTYAGGPRDNATLDNIKIYRVNQMGSRILIKLDIENPERNTAGQLDLCDEDTVQIDYSSVVTWKEIFSIISGPLALLASLALIIDRAAK
jgi:protein involved in polysaccharide export with SLBB domain